MDNPTQWQWVRQRWIRISSLLFLLGCGGMLVFAHNSLKNSAENLFVVEALSGIADRNKSILVKAEAEVRSGETNQTSFDELEELRSVVDGIFQNANGNDSGIFEFLVRIEASFTSAERLREGFGTTLETGLTSDNTQIEFVAILKNIDMYVSDAIGFMRHEEKLALETTRRWDILAMLFVGFAAPLLFADLLLTAKSIPQTTENDVAPMLPSLLTAAIRCADEGILITDTGTKGEAAKIVFANESFKRLAGLTDEDLIGKEFESLKNSCFLERELSLLEYSQPDSKSATMETIRLQKDGSKLHSEWHISPVRGDSARVTHYISILRDITSLREHEKAQRRSHQELVEVNRKLVEHQDQLIHSEKMAFLGQIAAGVAHEINNPLGYVMSYIEMLSVDLEDLDPLIPVLFEKLAEIDQSDNEKGNLNAKMIEKLEEFFRETPETLAESLRGLNRVKEIVQGLKNFARPSDSKSEFTDLNHEIELALKIVNSEIKTKCEVHTDFQDLPLVRCRAGQLNQVFTNLLANAAQSMSEWGEIRISTKLNGGEILISVADDGEGIAEDNMSKLFSPFFTTKPTGKGTGLGLAVSYGIVKNHNGTIEVESERGKGTTFTVRLPVESSESCRVSALGP